MGISTHDLKQLSVAERIQIVEDLWDSIAEDASPIGLTPAHVAELDKRLDDLEAFPEGGTPWIAARERILASL